MTQLGIKMISISKLVKDKKKYKSKILQGMPYKDITEDFIKNLDNKDLNSMHYNSHKFYTYSCKRSHFKKYIPLIEERHGWIIKEMKKRGLKHDSPLSCKETALN